MPTAKKPAAATKKAAPSKAHEHDYSKVVAVDNETGEEETFEACRICGARKG